MPEPAITIAAAKVSKGDNLPPTRVVIHTTSPPKVPFPTASEAGKAMFEHVMESKERTIANNLRRQNAAAAAPTNDGGKRAPRQR